MEMDRWNPTDSQVRLLFWFSLLLLLHFQKIFVKPIHICRDTHIGDVTCQWDEPNCKANRLKMCANDLFW